MAGFLAFELYPILLKMGLFEPQALWLAEDQYFTNSTGAASFPEPLDLSDVGAWASNLSTMTPAPLVPDADGGANTHLFTEDVTGGNAPHRIEDTPLLEEGVFEASIYVKAITLDILYISSLNTPSTDTAFFLLSTGTLGTVDPGVRATIEDVGNGWFKCTAVFLNATGAAAGVRYGSARVDNFEFYPVAGGDERSMYLYLADVALSKVRQWHSTDGRHVWSQSTPQDVGGVANMPLWDPTGWSDDTPVVEFNTGGPDKFLECRTLNFNNGADWSLVVALDVRDATTVEQYLLLLDQDAATSSFYLTGPVNALMGYDDAATAREAEVLQTGEQVLTYLLDPTELLCHFFQGDEYSATRNYSGALTYDTDGVRLGFGTGRAIPDCKVKAIALYDSTLSIVQAKGVGETISQYAGAPYTRTHTLQEKLRQLGPCELCLLSSLDVTVIPTDVVSAWGDQSIQDHDHSNATTGEQPDFLAVDSVFNGKPSLSWDGSNDRLTSNDLSSDWIYLHDGSGMTLMWIMRLISDGTILDTLLLLNSRIGIETTWDIGTKRIRFLVGNGSGTYLVDQHTAVGSLPDNLNHILTIRLGTGETSEFDIRINGASVASGSLTGAPSVASPTGTLTLGNFTGVGGGSPFGGKLPAVLSWSKYLSDAMVLEGETLLSEEYGL